MLGLAIWTIVLAYAVKTEKLWPEGAYTILGTTILLLALSLLMAGPDRTGEGVDIWNPAVLAYNFAIKFISTTIIFLIGFAGGKLWRRRQRAKSKQTPVE